MESELQLISSVKKYLEGLGYPSSNIVFEVPQNGNIEVDLIVKDEDKILIVVEIKSFMFESIKSKEQLGYHPITRNLQKAAIDMGAKYFIISDGKQHLWLVTGETGRPEEIQQIRFTNFNSSTLSNSQFTKEILSHVKELVRNYPISGDYIYDMSLILYSKIIQEKYSVKTIPEEIEKIIARNDERSYSWGSTNSFELLIECINRLSFVNLIENRFAVMEFIDELLQDVKLGLTIPRWIATLMANLIDLENDDKIIEIFSYRGVMLSAAHLHGYNYLTSYYLNTRDFFWIQVQGLLTSSLNYNKESIVKLNSLSSTINLDDTAKGVLLAFPFNERIDYFKASHLGHSGVTDGNLLFVEAALNLIKDVGRVVAIVPDSFLFSKNYEKGRQYFLDVSNVECVISLPPDSFKPVASVKCSIVVLSKSKYTHGNRTFFGSINRPPKQSFENIIKEDSVNAVLDKFEMVKGFLDFEGSREGFYVDKLYAGSFHFSRYWFESKDLEFNGLQSGFQSIPLKEVLRGIQRGGSIVTDTEGDISYVGPGAVRGLQITTTEFSFTSQVKLPKGNIKRVEEGEVLVNMIGSYRGAAALVGPENAGYLINRHIVALNPNTDLILPGYLAVAMNSNFVREQFYDRSIRTVIPSLNLSTLDNIYLPIPTLEVQAKIYDEYRLNLLEIENLRLKSAILQGKINSRLMTLGKEGVNL